MCISFYRFFNPTHGLQKSTYAYNSLLSYHAALQSVNGFNMINSHVEVAPVQKQFFTRA